MTEKEVRKLALEGGIENLPWNEPCFVWVPGRFYLGMALVPIPHSVHPPHGGDVTGMVWRYEATPLEWVHIFRFRWYAGLDAWDGKDRKTWMVAKFKGDEAEAEKRLIGLGHLVSVLGGAWAGVEPPKVSPFWIRGDSNKLFYLQENGKMPDWLHHKVEHLGHAE
jgi:hypothetical protein